MPRFFLIHSLIFPFNYSFIDSFIYLNQFNNCYSVVSGVSVCVLFCLGCTVGCFLVFFGGGVFFVCLFLCVCVCVLFVCFFVVVFL